MKSNILLILFIVVTACASEKNQKGIAEDFQPILDFMEYKPGMTFADVGAGNGNYTVMMSSLMDRSVVYIQDIDTKVLNDAGIDKTIKKQSKRLRKDLRSKNTFHVTIGTVEHTNLPDQTFDLIFSNATAHNFTEFDSMVTDIGKKLKPGGALYMRDSFKNHNGEKEFCSDPSCARALLSIDDFLASMKKNGFVLIKRNENMSGYPVLGFKVSL